MAGIGPVPPRASATACPQLRKADAASPAHPSIDPRKLAHIRSPRQPLNERGATTCAPDEVTFITARPRWLEPSLRKRNTPSIPVKPDGLVSVSVAKRCCPWVLASAAT